MNYIVVCDVCVWVCVCGDYVIWLVEIQISVATM